MIRLRSSDKGEGFRWSRGDGEWSIRILRSSTWEFVLLESGGLVSICCWYLKRQGRWKTSLYMCRCFRRRNRFKWEIWAFAEVCSWGGYVHGEILKRGWRSYDAELLRVLHTGIATRDEYGLGTKKGARYRVSSSSRHGSFSSWQPKLVSFFHSASLSEEDLCTIGHVMPR